MEPNKTGWRRVKKVFGNEVFNPDMTLNRDKLGEVIFDNPAMRKQLNKCLHGLIFIEIIKQIIISFFKGKQ